jgi:putative ABC transport system permease protein
MAWRNLWRNRRRTLVTVAAMSLALLAMILYAGLLEGFIRGIERSVLDLEVGDLQVFAGDYRDNPSIYTRIEDLDPLLASFDREGFRASPRLLGYGMAAADEASAGVSLRGVDIERDAQVSLIHEQLAQGTWLDPADRNGVVVGRRLARALGLQPGSELIVLTQGADGSMAYDRYHVRGVLLGISAATDRTGIFMTADAFRELMVVPEGVHQIVIRRPASLDLLAAAIQLRGLAQRLDVQTWRQLMPMIATMMDSMRGAMIFMSIIMYLAVAILILNAMLMAVFERIREFGVLKALGVSPFDVLRMILAESAFQTGIAILVGLALGVPGIIYLERVGLNLASLGGIPIGGIAMDPVWRAAVTGYVFLAPVLTLVFIVLFAVIYPALKAALIQPVAAMRHR